MKDGDAEKRAIWAKIIQARGEMGYPYIFFTDNVNNNTVDVYKDKKMKIHSSNLCTEIMLPTSTEESFVCCLNSINIAKYDEWKDTDAVECMIYFLDAVMQELELLDLERSVFTHTFNQKWSHLSIQMLWLSIKRSLNLFRKNHTQRQKNLRKNLEKPHFSNDTEEEIQLSTQLLQILHQPLFLGKYLRVLNHGGQTVT